MELGTIIEALKARISPYLPSNMPNRAPYEAHVREAQALGEAPMSLEEFQRTQAPQQVITPEGPISLTAPPPSEGYDFFFKKKPPKLPPSRP